MKILKIKRKVKYNNFYNDETGLLISKIVIVKLYLFNVIPIKKINTYKETYSGDIKKY